MKKRRICIILLTLVMLMSVVFAGCKKKSDKDSAMEYKKGTVTDTTFESEYLNVKYTLPENYTMVSQEEMDQIMQSAAEVVYTDDKMIDYAKSVLVYEFMAKNEKNDNINISLENLKGKKVGVDEYVEFSKKQLTNSGLPYTYDDETTKETLAGNDYTVLKAHVEYNGISLDQDLYIRKIGDRMMSLIFSYQSEDELQKMKDSISPYK